MLVRYCATHVRHFGFPRLLGVRWNGWAIASAGGLCEACRERERTRWEADPYGEVLVPAPVELGPRMLGRRVIVATIAAAAAATLATVALLVVHPPDLIPSGGDPGLFSSGARFAGLPPAQAEPRSEPTVMSQRDDPAPALPRAGAPRAASHRRRAVASAIRGTVDDGCAVPAVAIARRHAPGIAARPVAAVVAVQSP